MKNSQIESQGLVSQEGMSPRNGKSPPAKLSPRHLRALPIIVTAVPRQALFPIWRQLFLLVYLLCLASLLGGGRTVAGQVKLQNDGVMHYPVDGRGGSHGVSENALPFREYQARGNAQGRAVIGFSNEAE